MHPQKTYAVIVAGGQGTRMGTAVPKQFLDLQGKPVLYHAIQAFLHALPDISVILVLPEQQISYAQMILQAFSEPLDLTITAGGNTRFESVQNGLQLVAPHEESIVFVHDGVRPLLSQSLILRCYQQALALGSAIPAIPVADSMRMLEANGSVPVDRIKMRIIQTPQTFRSSLLLPAFKQPYTEAFTDEATVVEAYGTPIFLIDGQRSNLKITMPEDLQIAAVFLKMDL
jgi:2-C-methyl-D-erythritol 4-phosphate cytidylyltransferase